MISASDQKDFPGSRISNGIVTADLYFPDAGNGYYRGTRFDWSGVIPALSYKGHSYFGKWFEEYRPDIHDAIMGPVEEFTAIGYDVARAGETFLKPGVGMLVKPDESAYAFFKTYKLTNAGTWTVDTKPDQILFKQIFQDKEFAYEYNKTVRLVKGKPELVLSHVFKNTGRNAIETSVYDHNFFMIDNAPSGPDIRVKFAFKAGGKFEGPANITKFVDNMLLLNRELKSGENIYSAGITGVGNTASDYDIRIENIKTGAGVRIKGDRPLLKLVLWACPTTLCPEPYIQLKVQPGEEFTWNLTYEFYTFDKTK